MSVCLSHLHILMDGKTERTFGMSDRCTNKWPQWHIASEHQLWEKYPKKAIFKKRLKKSEKIIWSTCCYLFVDICLYSGTNYKSSHISMRSWWFSVLKGIFLSDDQYASPFDQIQTNMYKQIKIWSIIKFTCVMKPYLEIADWNIFFWSKGFFWTQGDEYLPLVSPLPQVD